MLNIDKQSGIPVYEQIIEQIKRLILLEILDKDEQIPSVRSLSLELSVNPNTIQKAYNELEMSGVTYSVPGVGRFVSKDAKRLITKDYIKQLNNIYEISYWLALADVEQSNVVETIKKAYHDAANLSEKG
ncbi:MAG TPA: GntR family transcriptional regulator [Ruminiclostridium sp.]|nr:GntR family transcriptional regulator [Ruminiclostridium sp.]